MRKREISTLGATLRQLRKERRWSLRAVQARTGISNAYLSQIETGQIVTPSPHLLRKLADAYQVSYEILFAEAGYSERGDMVASGRISTALRGVQLSEEDETQLLGFIKSLLDKKKSTD